MARIERNEHKSLGPGLGLARAVENEKCVTFSIGPGRWAHKEKEWVLRTVASPEESHILGNNRK